MPPMAEPRPFTFPFVDAYDLTAATGQGFQVLVGLPYSYQTSDAAYPVLYVLDPEVFYATALETCRVRGGSGEVQEVIVVGVGYPPDVSFMEYGLKRAHEFSATPEWDPDSPVMVELRKVTDAVGYSLRLGGAPALRDFLADQVQPFVADRYRTVPGDTGLYGCSAGGNFAGFTLLTRPEAFAKYILASPAFIYNDWHVLTLEEDYAAAHDDLPASVYIAAGSDEPQQLTVWQIVSGTARIAEALLQRKYPSLRLRCEFLTGKTHVTAAPEVFTRGLDFCWPGNPMAAYDYDAIRDQYRERWGQAGV
jgi:predicted alpha/beta superfamily hydrolase